MNSLGNISGINWDAIWVTSAALLAFGTLYNYLVLHLSRRGHNDGYTWLLVVIGVGITILAAGFTIGWTAVILLGIYFAASGLPMAIGDIYRHILARRAERGDD